MGAMVRHCGPVASRPRPVRRVRRRPDAEVDPTAWPDSMPAVRQLLTQGLDLPARVTFLVGENGAGKSTVIEGIAEALEVPAEGGVRRHASGETGAVDSARSGARLQVLRGSGAAREVFFLRAETMHVVGAPWMRQVGLFLLDEPESASSFQNSLVLGASFAQMAAEGKQVLCATHSPALTALPGAHVLQVDEQGLTRVDWEDLAIVKDWRFFLDAPQRYWRRVL